ncbi:MAG: isochorismatase family cysteine hydrolase [bacterium]|nr:isochorismatase family cysteine hydrolase [bacterium]
MLINTKSADEFIASHREFLGFLANFQANCPVLSMADLAAQAGGPQHVALIAVDVVKGFCSQGPMSSPRVSRIVPEVTRIIKTAAGMGIDNFLFTCDSHQPDSREFSLWPAHCVEGTPEAELEEALLQLPQADKFIIIPKPSINSLISTELVRKLETIQPKVLIAMGDVTDLCYYQLATNLKMLAIAKGWDCRVIAPLSAVETYDTPLTTAKELGILPHDAEFINAFFSYHLQVTGVEAVKDLC